MIATPDDVGKDTLNEDGTEIAKDKQRRSQGAVRIFGLSSGCS